ncbi:hypothetical protein GCM10007276_28510 [Agaricicola taiwanensis]|uniref:Uncharacterized protein n=1 Tax=Agaricicola taiwanensis TaxID=591372 RepID=A0A8J2YKE6_9RHOB|nr:hypothetical protein GCM10007276_28510 [Agaricicola taiwanensis]
MGDAPRVARQIRLSDGRDVANSAINNKSGQFALNGDVQHDLPKKSTAQISPAIDDEDIARPDQIEGFVHGEIIAGPGSNREGHSDHYARCSVKGLQTNDAW